MYHVIKADKTREPFSEQKIISSIKRAGVPQSLQGEILTHVKSKLYDGISTGEIYRYILAFLTQSSKPYIKSKYSLKESIAMLGPTGYPFEDFVAKILEAQGYQTKVRQILNGKCITHEIDIVAKKEERTSIIEAKFHNSPGARSEIHVALYTQARFEDVRTRNSVDNVWLVTNTRTTIDANTYAACMGMKIMSWDYPSGEGLRDLIEKSGLHPITLLASLSNAQKETLLENHIILCKDIVTNPIGLNILYLSPEEHEKILSEAEFICKEKTR